MAGNKVTSFGPVALSSTLTTNILNPGTGARATPPTGVTDTDDYMLIRRLRAVNKTTSPVTVSLWIGATGANAAGTEFGWQAAVIPANSFLEIFPMRRLTSAQFLVGGAGTATAASIEGDIEIGKS